MNTSAARAGALVAIGMVAALAITVPALRALALAVTVAIIGMLGWLLSRSSRDAAAQHVDSNALRQANVDLEGRIQTGARESLATSERLRSIIDSAVDSIIVIDQNGLIEAFNPAAERLFGYQHADVIGRNVSMLMPSPYHEEHDGYLSRYLNSGNA